MTYFVRNTKDIVLFVEKKNYENDDSPKTIEA